MGERAIAFCLEVNEWWALIRFFHVASPLVVTSGFVCPGDWAHRNPWRTAPVIFQ
jgi:hypothetical protein